MKKFLITLSLSFILIHGASADLCIRLLGSTLTGNWIAAFKDESCEKADAYCADAKEATPIPDGVWTDSAVCSGNSNFIVRRDAGYRLFLKGVLVKEFTATRYSMSSAAAYELALKQVAEECAREQKSRIYNSYGRDHDDWVNKSLCSGQSG